LATSEHRDRPRKAGPSKPAKASATKKTSAAKKSASKRARPTSKPRTAPAAVKSAVRPVRSKAKPTKGADPAERLRSLVLNALDDLKARDVEEIDVRGKSGVTDLMVVASGTSSRHVKSIAEEVVKKAKQAGLPPIGVEGQREAEWVLVDLGDIVVHVMLPRTREFYGLERLWTVGDQMPAALAS